MDPPESGRKQALLRCFWAKKRYGKFIEAALSQEEASQFEATLTKLVKVFKQAGESSD
jgi:hypothetical protein